MVGKDNTTVEKKDEKPAVPLKDRILNPIKTGATKVKPVAKKVGIKLKNIGKSLVARIKRIFHKGNSDSDDTESEGAEGVESTATPKLKKKRPNLDKKIHDWFVGTPEKPVPLFGKRARLRRWWLVKFRGYVYHITTIFDKPSMEYLYDKDIIPRKNLPKTAVRVVNQKNTYHTDLDCPIRGFSTKNDNGFTAVDAFLYMRCNKLSEAMRIPLDRAKPMDSQKLLIIGAVAVFGAVLAYYMMSGMTV